MFGKKDNDNKEDAFHRMRFAADESCGHLIEVFHKSDVVKKLRPVTHALDLVFKLTVSVHQQSIIFTDIDQKVPKDLLVGKGVWAWQPNANFSKDMFLPIGISPVGKKNLLVDTDINLFDFLLGHDSSQLTIPSLRLWDLERDTVKCFLPDDAWTWLLSHYQNEKPFSLSLGVTIPAQSLSGYWTDCSLFTNHIHWTSSKPRPWESVCLLDQEAFSMIEGNQNVSKDFQTKTVLPDFERRSLDDRRAEITSLSVTTEARNHLTEVADVWDVLDV